MTQSVLVDTCFLITLYKEDAEHHQAAKRYYKYFIQEDIRMLLSTVVISEFHQMQSILEVINSKAYITLPFNYQDAIETAETAFRLGAVDRLEQPRAEFKDDLKLIGQICANQIDFVITEDERTLAKYCEQLKSAGLLDAQVILLKDGFDATIFNGGQTELVAPVI